jgi:hypothetical protein
MDINLGPGMFSWQLKKTPNLKQCSTMNQQRQTSPDNFGQIDIYSIYTHPRCEANEDSWGHGSSSQTEQVILESIDHNWFFAKIT